MARLDPSERAGLPDRAFAYIDASGKRRLPIHDAAHVRNALARFGQVDFEDDKARDEARIRLLKAAKRFKIVPVGFIAGQLESERALGPRAGGPVLPSGFVTMLMTDIEGSTALVRQLGDGYRALIDEVWELLRRTVADNGGHEVEARADEFFAVFEAPAGAVGAAVAMQRELLARTWDDDLDVKVRDTNYIGLDVHVTSRICAVGHGCQVIISANTREALQGAVPEGIRFRALGSRRLRGIPDAVPLYQLLAKGLPGRFPPLR
jgi:class 3 adenylate cyclase